MLFKDLSIWVLLLIVEVRIKNLNWILFSLQLVSRVREYKKIVSAYFCKH